jgi:hypothetical protein
VGRFVHEGGEDMIQGRYEVDLQPVVDLRSPIAAAAVGVSGAPGSFIDQGLCRSTARHVRSADASVQGLLVPSVAFLDNTDRWSLVVYLDRVPPNKAFLSTAYMGTLGYRMSWLDRLREVRRRVRMKSRRWFRH